MSDLFDPGPHGHDWRDERTATNERRTRVVVWLTLVTMAVEIAAGYFYGSMALLADGWHMASHAGALGVAAFAYAFARRRAGDAAFSFGTGKVADLGAYTSALALLGIAGLMAWESAKRFVAPVPIRYDEALFVAVVGLLVNLLSAWLLGHDHDHDHGHDHGHDHSHDHSHDPDHDHDHDHDDHDVHEHAHDLNLRAAYLHVLADAVTSVGAIVALGLGRRFGWAFLDSAVGIAGSLLVGAWAIGLLRQSSAALLDRTPDPALPARVRALLEAEPGVSVHDVHAWRLAPGRLSLMVSLDAREPRPPVHYRRRLAGLPGLVHLTVEVNPAPSAKAGIDIQH